MRAGPVSPMVAGILSPAGMQSVSSTSAHRNEIRKYFRSPRHSQISDDETRERERERERERSSLASSTLERI